MGRSVLIVEDDALMRSFVADVLAGEGHRVEVAPDGASALALLEREPFDLVITDIIMPEQDGIEAIMDLRRGRPELKLIAISGGGRAEPENYLHSAQLLGANRTLRKPFTNEAILAAVKDLIA